MNRCEKCQSEYSDGALFCSTCGHYLRSEFIFSWDQWLQAYQLYLLEAKNVLSTNQR
ncbi:MAG: zinc-ribbon domain-containing protein [Promethearchaeota archaeon]